MREIARLFAFAIVFTMAGWSAAQHFGWKDWEVSRAYSCGVLRETRAAKGIGKTDSDTEELCDRLMRADWTKETYAEDACFAIYNDRPHDKDRSLPFSQEAHDKMDECFHKLHRATR